MLCWLFLNFKYIKAKLAVKKKIASLWIIYLNIMILPFIPGMIISRLYNLKLGCQINLNIFNVCES